METRRPRPVRRPVGAIRRLAHLLEGAGLWLTFLGFRMLPLDAASALGGRVARWIGPRLRVTGNARHNLRHAFPEKSAAEIEDIIRGMWDNLGRVLAEYPHLSRLDLYAPGGRVEVIGAEIIDRLRDDGRPGIAFSAHFGNWEIVAMAATQRGMPLTRFYRAPNNPHADAVLRLARRHIAGELLPKGPQGARRALHLLRQGEHLGLLVDQKLNDGIPVPFFGRPAMTAPALAQLALKFDCPVVPARVERTGGARFRVTVFPPMDLPRTGDRAADVAETMRRVNRIIEGWIRERPEQWLWIHRRWSD